MLDSKLDNISTDTTRGIGIRLIKGDEYYYTSTNDIRKANIKKIIKSLNKIFNEKIDKKIVLNTLEEYYPKIKIPHEKYPIEKKKDYLIEMDKKIREISNQISQVSLSLLEDDKEYIIANSNGKFVKSRNCVTRYMCTTFAKDKNNIESEFTDFAQPTGYEFLEKDL